MIPPCLRVRLPIPLVGGHGGAETPVPIPNTAVKAPRGDDTAFKSAGKQRGANLFLKAPGSPKGIRGPFPYGGGGIRKNRKGRNIRKIRKTRKTRKARNIRKTRRIRKGRKIRKTRRIRLDIISGEKS